VDIHDFGKRLDNFVDRLKNLKLDDKTREDIINFQQS